MIGCAICEADGEEPKTMIRIAGGLVALALLTAPCVAGPKENMQATLAVIDAEIGIEPTFVVPEFGACPDDSKCSASVGDIQIDTYGQVLHPQLADATSYSIYRNVCAASLAGLTGMDFESSKDFMQQAFDQAGLGGEGVRLKLSKAEVYVGPGIDDRPECKFWRDEEATPAAGAN
ncbi:hypothetical protein [Antarcticirhabdus aurantiaca]|uniref:hypothetical protein n=1 Tax=Antarcticirhabdus aurantiaca TaxID=2606717 RepID=UPI00131A6811|nr:hypothetical protein [Antarcticirhabdus aurantiaca]